MADVKNMTYWEFTAASGVINSWYDDPDKVDAPTEEMFDRSMAMLASNPKMVN